MLRLHSIPRARRYLRDEEGGERVQRNLAASQGAPPPRTIDRSGDVALAPWVYPWLRRAHGWAPGDPLPPCAQGPDRGARAALLHAEPQLGGALLWALEVVGPWGYHALIDVRGAARRQEAWWWALDAARLWAPPRHTPSPWGTCPPPRVCPAHSAPADHARSLRALLGWGGEEVALPPPPQRMGALIGVAALAAGALEHYRAWWRISSPHRLDGPRRISQEARDARRDAEHCAGSALLAALRHLGRPAAEGADPVRLAQAVDLAALPAPDPARTLGAALLAHARLICAEVGVGPGWVEVGVEVVEAAAGAGPGGQMDMWERGR
jgi:hypothetical protein